MSDNGGSEIKGFAMGVLTIAGGIVLGLWFCHVLHISLGH